jgi:molecular chaperone GrpE
MCDEKEPNANAPIQSFELLEKEKVELHDQLLRTAAELDNQRKRAKREVEEAERRGREQVIENLVPVLDDLDRALHHAPPGPLTTGVRLVGRQLLGRLEKFNVTRFSAQGAPFNPELHHALEQRETVEFPPGSVAEEFAAGYLHGGRLLRPALVAVAKAPPASQAEGSEPEAAS